MPYQLTLATHRTINPSLYQGETPGASHYSIHATNVLAIDKDKLLVVWFGGTWEKDPDTAIWGTVYPKGLSHDDSGLVRIAKVGMVAHWNPITIRSEDRITCFFKVGNNCSAWRTWITESFNGITWSRPTLMVDGDFTGRGPSKCKPIVLSNGILIAPGSREMHGWAVQFDRFIRGKWQVGKPLFAIIDPPPNRGSANGVIQPAIWESSPGMVHALMRSSHGYVYRSDSMDYGDSWCDPYPTSIPNNNSGIDVVQFEDHLAIIYNPVSENWGSRSPLSVVLSDDNGHTWYNQIDIEIDRREFSYPSLIYHNGMLVASYTDSRRKVGLAEITISPTRSKISVY
jgi:predicted neuraminidase